MASLLLIGSGKMGGALLSRWAESRPAGINHFAVIEPTLQTSYGDVRYFTALENLPEAFKPNVIVFAVKPQQLHDILPAYAKRFGAKPLYMSIAAGKSLAFFESHLKDAAIVRAMPNTPALIGEGMSALYANAKVSDGDKKTAEALLAAAGKTVWLSDETLMDAATAISGSGPAYLFLFMEALQQAALECGLPEDTATMLVRQTVKGGALLAQDGDFSALRKQVTSPGGTTEAALAALQKDGFERLICDAAKAAMRRAKDLNKRN